jgi:hypothetical protein
MRISALLVRSPGNRLSSEIDCGGRFPAAEESPSGSSIPNLGSRNEKKNRLSKQNRGPSQELINARDCTLETCQELRRIENNCVKFLRTGNQASLFSTWQPDLRINRNRQCSKNKHQNSGRCSAIWRQASSRFILARSLSFVQARGTHSKMDSQSLVSNSTKSANNLVNPGNYTNMTEKRIELSLQCTRSCIDKPIIKSHERHLASALSISPLCALPFYSARAADWRT